MSDKERSGAHSAKPPAKPPHDPGLGGRTAVADAPFDSSLLGTFLARIVFRGSTLIRLCVPRLLVLFRSAGLYLGLASFAQLSLVLL